MKTKTTIASLLMRARPIGLTIPAILMTFVFCALSSFVAIAQGDDRITAMESLSANVVDRVAATDAAWSEFNSVAHFNGRPVTPVGTIRMKVTAYSPDARSCGKFADGITASGYSVLTNGGMMVAADTRLLPFGTLLSIPGYDAGGIVPVLDRGGAIKGNRLDVLFPTHEAALQWGVRDLVVTIWDYADGRGTQFKRGEY